MKTKQRTNRRRSAYSLFRQIAVCWMLLAVVVYTFMGFHHHHGERTCFRYHEAKVLKHVGCGLAEEAGKRATAMLMSRMCSHAHSGGSYACRKVMSAALQVSRSRVDGSIPDLVIPAFWAAVAANTGVLYAVILYESPFSYPISLAVRCQWGYLTASTLRAPPSVYSYFSVNRFWNA
ncbi:MAG: hypothetical protein NC388_03705 [Clostridium sp.]|nr:hypothetical protein [Clostridium sp.]